MRKQISTIVFCALCASGCESSPDGIVIPAGVVSPSRVLIGIPTLEGQWVLSGDNGQRSCLTIQELRVSIVDFSCTPGGRGLAPRVVYAPKISQSGDGITLEVTFDTALFESSQRKIMFSGHIQPDGTYRGVRRDIDLANPDEATETPAVLARP